MQRNSRRDIQTHAAPKVLTFPELLAPLSFTAARGDVAPASASPRSHRRAPTETLLQPDDGGGDDDDDVFALRDIGFARRTDDLFRKSECDLWQILQALGSPRQRRRAHLTTLAAANVHRR